MFLLFFCFFLVWCWWGVESMAENLCTAQFSSVCWMKLVQPEDRQSLVVSHICCKNHSVAVHNYFNLTSTVNQDWLYITGTGIEWTQYIRTNVATLFEQHLKIVESTLGVKEPVAELLYVKEMTWWVVCRMFPWHNNALSNNLFYFVILLLECGDMVA